MCVGLNVGDESASLLVFSVCADGSVVCSRCLSSSTVLLMPFALS